MSRFESPLRKFFRTIVLLCVVWAVAPLHASTVLQMSFAEVVENAELVFEGRVLSVESRMVPDGMIHTFVVFAVIDILKGDYALDEIELSFLGGQVGTRRLQVTDMELPEVGETGFYFVESLMSAQVNPLVGWAQGHYLIELTAGGGSVVTTADHEPILALDPASPVTAAMSNEFSKGVAKGVVVQGAGIANRLSRGLSAEEFKDHVRSTVASQQ
ncbi:MAG: hypothetical protein Q8L60_09735 [Gammaproteobacteria bacterium]|nr:hypothetical protein [Gammaproteobacteria bacterium]MDP2139755.1 hypothetical protein [Gammaproteobacteria bacterium]MDP2348957.1 hypothetical protein [Gammaproteobacteria bacterium]